jgi:hypothetical protein
MADRVMKPQFQYRVLDPSAQRTEAAQIISDPPKYLNPSFYLGHAFNEILQVIGNDVVLKGLDVSVNFNDTDIAASVSPGQLIQDSTLLILSGETNNVVNYSNANLLDLTNGRFVVYVDWQYLYASTTENFLNIGIEYVSIKNATPYGFSGNLGWTPNTWLSTKYRTILDIIKVEKSTISNNIIAAYSDTTMQSIYIGGPDPEDINHKPKEYFRGGLNLEKNFGLTKYLKALNAAGLTGSNEGPGAGIYHETSINNTMYFKSLVGIGSVRVDGTLTDQIQISADAQLKVSQTEPLNPNIDTCWIRRV